MMKKTSFAVPALLGLSLLPLLGLGSGPARAGLLPMGGILPIHRGVIAPLTAHRAFEAVVKLEVQKTGSMIEFGRCTGAFISDRHVLTAAHCFGDGRKAYLSIPHAAGFWQPGTSEDVTLSEDRDDIAIVRFPPGTFTGRPLDFRVFDDQIGEALAAEAADPANTLLTLGYGQTESGLDSDTLLYSRIGEFTLNSHGEFETRDRRRVDHGDSGGPVLMIQPGGRVSIIAVNHAYVENHPEIQLFKPVVSRFVEAALESGLDLPVARCECTELVRYTSRAVTDRGPGRIVRSWSESEAVSHRRLDRAARGCGEFVRPASQETYPGEDLADGTATEILKRGSGVTCRERLPRHRVATMGGFESADSP